MLRRLDGGSYHGIYSQKYSGGTLSCRSTVRSKVTSLKRMLSGTISEQEWILLL